MKLIITTSYSDEPVVTPIDNKSSSFEFSFLFALIPWSGHKEIMLEINESTYLHFKKINPDKGLVTLTETETLTIHKYTYHTNIELINSFDLYRRKPDVYKRLMNFISEEEYEVIRQDSEELVGSQTEQQILQMDTINEKIENRESMLTVSIIVFIGAIVLFIIMKA